MWSPAKPCLPGQRERERERERERSSAAALPLCSLCVSYVVAACWWGCGGGTRFMVMVGLWSLFCVCAMLGNPIEALDVNIGQVIAIHFSCVHSWRLVFTHRAP
ncbi:unnamed protein product, partial [Discosporangium mesarthrocarpum]